MEDLQREFVPYELAIKLKAIGFDEPCLGYRAEGANVMIKETPPCVISAPTFSQAINFLYICSNKQIDIELKASDTYEERLRKIDQGCEDLWNLQNSKSN